MICLTLTERTLEADIAVLTENRSHIDMAELRLDYILEEELPKAVNLPKWTDVPLILTFRRVIDGGYSMISDRQRMQILKDTMIGGYRYVDIEEDIRKSDLGDIEQVAHDHNIRIIRSYHNFESVPDDIFGKVARLHRMGDIPKVAVTPRSILDVIKIFRIKKELAEIPEKIIVGMGDYGVCTRLLYKQCGSMLTFCSLNQTAPGQLTPQVMDEVYNLRQLNDKTHIFGIIGNPVLHTSSPMIHNIGFRTIKYNAIYVPFLVDSCRNFFKLAEMLEIHGFSVTIPHKTDILPYLGKTTREVKQIGACNTVVRIPGLWKGMNTDYYGFLEPMKNQIHDESVRNAIVIGAGGASRAVVFALINNGIKVTILNRTVEKAKSLAIITMSKYDSLENAGKYTGKADIIVQCTNVGMEPDAERDPAPDLGFTGKEIVYDLIYKPAKTRFLTRAENAGCRIVPGARMLLEQGKFQFEFFTGYHYPYWIEPKLN